MSVIPLYSAILLLDQIKPVAVVLPSFMLVSLLSHYVIKLFYSAKLKWLCGVKICQLRHIPVFSLQLYTRAGHQTD